jgi:hypothetical protein
LDPSNAITVQTLLIAISIADIELLPQGVFKSFDALFKFIQTQGILAGYAYITERSEQKKRR